MDLETENRLAALLLEEAQRLRLQADAEGVQAYLRQPNVRYRPNSRFLAATVLGVQQANRVVEVNEMWRAREKELEIESKMKSRNNDHGGSRGEKRKSDSRNRGSSSKNEQEGTTYDASSSMRDSCYDKSYSDKKDGLGDDEIEEFLHSRVKRGRGAIGSRMDEPGPYLTAPSDRQDDILNPDVRVKEEWERRVRGPEKPLFLRSTSPDDSWNRKTSDEEPYTSQHRHKKEKKKEKNSNKKEKEKKRSRHRRRCHHKSRRRE